MDAAAATFFTLAVLGLAVGTAIRRAMALCLQGVYVGFFVPDSSKPRWVREEDARRRS